MKFESCELVCDETKKRSLFQRMGIGLVALAFLAPLSVGAANPEDCATPPEGMVGWWPFDEFPGGSTAEDTVNDNHGAYVGAPVPDFGKVGGGITVDSFGGSADLVEIPHHSAYDFGEEDFSIDLWLKPFTRGTFLSKHDGNIGWELALDEISNFHLMVTVEGEGGGPSYENCGQLPSSSVEWFHLAMRVDRSTNVIRCYADGAEIGEIGNPVVGSVSNSVPIKAGMGSTLFTEFRGVVDELELFNRRLSNADVAAVAGAGAFGKCKDGGYAPWDKPFCLGANEITVPSTVCNYHVESQVYSIASAVPLPTSFHYQCNIPGPTEFEVLTPALTVPPGECRDFLVEIERPAAMTIANTISCYQVNFENMSNGSSFSRAASLWDTRDQCTTVEPQGPWVPSSSVIDIPQGEPLEITFAIENTGGDRVVPIELRVEPANMDEDNTLISLDGNEAGTPVRGELEFRGRRATASVWVKTLGYDPFRFFNITLVANPGEREVILDSVGVRALPGVIDAASIFRARSSAKGEAAPSPAGGGSPAISE